MKSKESKRIAYFSKTILSLKFLLKLKVYSSRMNLVCFQVDEQLEINMPLHSFIHSVIHSFNKYMWTHHHIPGAELRDEIYWGPEKTRFWPDRGLGSRRRQEEIGDIGAARGDRK